MLDEQETGQMLIYAMQGRMVKNVVVCNGDILIEMEGGRANWIQITLRAPESFLVESGLEKEESK